MGQLISVPLAMIVLAAPGFGRDWSEAFRASDEWTRESGWETVAAYPEPSLPISKIETARGAVVAIERGLARFTILPVDGRPLVIQVEMKSSLRLAGNEVEVWDVRLGDRVTVAYCMEDGRNIARGIVIER